MSMNNGAYTAKYVWNSLSNKASTRFQVKIKFKHKKTRYKLQDFKQAFKNKIPRLHKSRQVRLSCHQNNVVPR